MNLLGNTLIAFSSKRIGHSFLPIHSYKLSLNDYLFYTLYINKIIGNLCHTSFNKIVFHFQHNEYSYIFLLSSQNVSPDNKSSILFANLVLMATTSFYLIFVIGSRHLHCYLKYIYLIIFRDRFGGTNLNIFFFFS